LPTTAGNGFVQSADNARVDLERVHTAALQWNDATTAAVEDGTITNTKPTNMKAGDGEPTPIKPISEDSSREKSRLFRWQLA